MTEPQTERRKQNRRQEDIDLELRVLKNETEMTYFKEAVERIDRHLEVFGNKVDYHINDEGGEVERNTAQQHRLEQNIAVLNTTMVAFTKGIDTLSIAFNNLSAKHDALEKTISTWRTAGKTAWTLGGMLAVAVGALWSVFTYFKG